VVIGLILRKAISRGSSKFKVIDIRSDCELSETRLFTNVPYPSSSYSRLDYRQETSVLFCEILDTYCQPIPALLLVPVWHEKLSRRRGVLFFAGTVI
jgi:hypothetical protein